MQKELYIGFDTSNYTTSLAVCDSAHNVIANLKCPLAVKKGERGLRQSDAVFSHIKNIPEIAQKLRNVLSGFQHETRFEAAAASFTPRDSDGSYMPCFLVGRSIAETVCALLGVPLYPTSHQAGHIVAAANSACHSNGLDLTDFLNHEFLALHVSGGTTDLLHVRPDRDKIVYIEHVGGSADANAGQIIDRTGVRLGFEFPCGQQLDKEAQSFGRKVKGLTTSVKGLNCNLSGLENKALDLINRGAPSNEVSAYVLAFIAKTVKTLVLNAFDVYGKLPVIFAGGVMSSAYIKSLIGDLGYFSEPQYSADNAAGVAVIASILHKRSKE